MTHSNTLGLLSISGVNPQMAPILPQTIDRANQNDRAMDPYSRLFGEGIILLDSAIDDTVASATIAQLLWLKQQKPENGITMYIMSPGGSVTAGLAIYDTMRLIQPTIDVSTVALGMAASMGAFLLAGGTKGKRFALPNAEILIHQPLVHGGGISGQVTDIEIQAKHLVNVKNRLASILAANTGQSLERLLADTERDNIMTAKEAKEYGLIDRVLMSDEG